ncbi:hypothetical protein CAPTEDRAFT_225908 [Capitella teleta]|uniref:PNPLA domain-containing protein n=1 Tax=Capitella teleta TaxID=283909 RepID=R7TTZ2_CAPTE|nr:hypothetical protein CAPTEDRAFT_225908 [Capitella teleta]|eukprot:ELT94485.1 hypothetical protein CAPTEDRAFT_225908 [Capitella teleta]
MGCVFGGHHGRDKPTEQEDREIRGFIANGKAQGDWFEPTGTADYPFQNLIFSGGGVKGYTYVGSCYALEDSGVMKNIKRVAGTSAGAICAGLLAVGATAQEIADVFKCDIKWLFHDQQCACCCGLPKMLSSAYGVHPAKRFLKIYGEHIAAKVGNPDITFGELYEKYGRELCIVVTNLTRMQSEYCHPKTTPDMPIRTAVRMSMSFPLVYKAMKYKVNGVESLYTDGGVLDQYPIHCFDGPKLDLNVSCSEATDENENMDKSDDFSSLPFNDKSLGLYVVSEKALDYKIWKSLFEKELPCKPTYLPDTKLARAKLKAELSNRKRSDKAFNKKEYLGDLKSGATLEDEMEAVNLDHYQIHNKSLVDIRSFPEYFVTTLETLLVSQRKLHIRVYIIHVVINTEQLDPFTFATAINLHECCFTFLHPCDADRTVAINCGYIATNDYDIEPGDREFMIRQGYAHTMRFLQEHIHRTTDGPHPPLRRTRTEPANLSNGHFGNGLRRTTSEIPNTAESEM